jgi:hypothetical protein
MTSPILRRQKCGHCRRPVLLGRLQNGSHRKFEPDPVNPLTVTERNRYGVSKRYGCVVDLIGVRVTDPVLTPHYCEEYLHRNVGRAGSVMGSVLTEIETPQAPTQRSC